MRMPPHGRGVHPRFRPSSILYWPLDDTDPSVGLEIAADGGTPRPFGTYAALSEPAIINSPIGGLARRFVDGVASGDENILTAPGDATMVAALKQNFTFGAWFQIPVYPASSKYMYNFGSYSVDSAATNFLFSLQVTPTGLSYFWEHTGGVNVSVAFDPFGGIPRGEWIYWAAVKSDVTGDGPAGTCTMTTYLNGAQVDQQTGVINCSGGDDSDHYIGGRRDNLAATTGAVFYTGDLAGLYMWDEVLAQDEIEDDHRRGQAIPFYNRTDHRLEITDPNGAVVELTDLEGVDWVDSVSVTDSAESPTKTATATLHREVGDLSLAQLRTDSKLNLTDKTDPTSYDPLIKVKRTVTFKAARIPLGIVADEDELTPLITGKLDKVSWGAENMILEWRDQGGKLTDTYIEQEVNYSEPLPDQQPAGTGPFPSEDEMQQILNDNDNDGSNNTGSAFPNDDPPLTITSRTGSYDPITLYIQEAGGLPIVAGVDTTIVNWDLLIWRQRREPVLAACRNIAGMIAWEARYRWSDYLQEWIFAFYEPQRDRIFPSFTLRPGEIQTVSNLSVDAQRIRTVFRGVYSSEEDIDPTASMANLLTEFNVVGTQVVDWVGRDGKNDTMRAFYQVEFTDAITEFERLFMEVADASTGLISTVAEVQRMMVGIGKDLSVPELDQGISMPLFWEAELQDVANFTPNRELYTGNQQLAVQSITHTFGEKAATSLKAAGKPRVGYKRWLNLETRPGVAEPGVAIPQDALTDRTRGRQIGDIRSRLRTDLDTGGKYNTIKNSEFAEWNCGVQCAPDGWTVTGGVIGTDLFNIKAVTRSGGNGVFFSSGALGRLKSDLFPVVGELDAPYSFEMEYKKASDLGNDPTMFVEFFASDRITSVGTDTLRPGAGGTPAGSPDFPAAPATTDWISARVDGVQPPATARFCRIEIGATDVGLTFTLDKATSYRTSRASFAENNAVAWGGPIQAPATAAENISMNQTTIAGTYDRGQSILPLAAALPTAPDGAHFLVKEPGTYDIEASQWFIFSGALAVGTADIALQLVLNGVYSAAAVNIGGAVVDSDRRIITVAASVGQEPIKFSSTLELVAGDRISIDYEYFAQTGAPLPGSAIPFGGPGSNRSFFSVKLRGLD